MQATAPSKAWHAPPHARVNGTTAAHRSVHHAMQRYHTAGNDAAGGRAGTGMPAGGAAKLGQDWVLVRVRVRVRLGLGLGLG